MGYHGNHTFSDSQNRFIFGEHFLHSGDARKQFSTHEKWSWGARLVKLGAEVVESQVGYGWSTTDSGLKPKLMFQSGAS